MLGVRLPNNLWNSLLEDINQSTEGLKGGLNRFRWVTSANGLEGRSQGVSGYQWLGGDSENSYCFYYLLMQLPGVVWSVTM